MKRRSFLKLSSTLSLPFFLNGIPIQALGNTPIMNFINEDSDRVLILVQLQGGNDGLNTIFPLDQYDNLAEVRSNIMVDQELLLDIGNNLAFHPNMTGMQEVWNNGKLNIVQAVGYENQNRSHFRSSDIWNSASNAEDFISTGWLGRYFENDHPTYPSDYPNESLPDPFALTIGTVVSETCQGTVANYSLALTDPFDPGSVNVGEEGSAPANCYGDELTYIRDIARQTNAYSGVIQQAANAGNSLSSKYDENSALAQKLAAVARLISGGLKTRVYVVQLGGFDTHGQQVSSNDTSTGEHPDLLQYLSDAICAFQEDLELLGLEERVLGMTYSEFGRRIRSNGSLGTDHGDAAPMFLFGSCVNAQVFGDNAVIDTAVDAQAGVPMQFDFRNVYGTVLADWFEVEESLIQNLLFEDFVKLPLINPCGSCATGNGFTGPGLSIKIFLEGAINPSTGLMRTELRTEELMPLNQPYGVAPWNYNGNESFPNYNSIPINTVDWILVELRSGTPNLSGSPGTVLIERVAGLLLEDGLVVGMDGSSPLAFTQLEEGEEYYVLVRHRNHLAVLSNETVRPSINMSYDFTECYAAFGTQQLKLVGEMYAMFAGDFNADATIQTTDYGQWQLQPAIVDTYQKTDANLDGTVQVSDYDNWFANRAKTSPAEVGL